jgi:large subunit ribosomal protein L22
VTTTITRKSTTMQVRSTYRFARISAFKAREVTREIQGLPASDALDLLRFVPKKAAGLVRQTLASAVANAENNNNLNVENLVVQEAVVGEGPTAKRFQPKARGSAGPIRKRTSHIRIILTDEMEIKRREKSGSKKSKKSARPATGKPARKSAQESQPAQAEAASAAPQGQSKE